MRPMIEAPSTAPVQSGVVERAPAVMFRDVTRKAGIDFEHFTGAYGDKLLPETMGSGVAALDDLRQTMEDILAAFRPGKNSWLSAILGKKVEIAHRIQVRIAS